MSNIILDGTKIRLYKDRVEQWLDGEPVVPITIDMALTRACNYKCEYCYSKLQENKAQHITLNIMRRFFDDCSELGVKGVSFVSDGESTCVPWFADAIVYGRYKGIAIALGTNGYLLNDKILERILPCLSYIRFNISGADDESYTRIMGAPKDAYQRVINNIATAMEIKQRLGLQVSIGMQMVLLPRYEREVIPLTVLARLLGVDYLVIKHCSDDEHGTLGVDYAKYGELEATLRQAETYSTSKTQIIVKWSKINEGNKRTYERCYGPPFILQISGTGLVAPCGMLFGEKYRTYHIGNICTKRLAEIIKGKKYRQVMDKIRSPQFNAKTMCGCLCLQHCVNKALDDVIKGGIDRLPECDINVLHKEFV
jgi:MoaA/NifB/PqqE/SkfB family radical SAM enzyme